MARKGMARRRRAHATLTPEQIAAIDWMHTDLNSPLWDALPKPPAKDHKCPHDRKDANGMEVCRACGDYGICRVCGEEYIRRDMYLYHDHLCPPDARVRVLEERLADAKREQAKRIADAAVARAAQEEAAG